MSAILSATIGLMLVGQTSVHTTWRRGHDGPSGYIWRDHAYLIENVPALSF